MTDWLPGGRERTRRLEALEGEVKRLLDRASADAGRLDEAAAGLANLGHRVLELSAALAGLIGETREGREAVHKDREASIAAEAARTAALSLATAELDRLREVARRMPGLEIRLSALESLAGAKAVKMARDKSDADDKRFVAMETALKRAERQLEIYAEEGRKTGAALLERIETMRNP